MATLIVAFVLAGVNPFGGLFVAIPLAMFKLDWPAWLAVVLAVPLSFTQVLAVDVLWDRLLAWPAWTRFLAKRRSARLEAWLAHRHAGVWLTLFSPWMGPWLVTALARFSGQRGLRVAVPLFLGLAYVGIGTALACLYAPDVLP